MFVNLIGAHNTAQFGVVWSCCTGSFTGDYTGHLTRTTKNHLGCISFPTNHNIQVQASFLLGELLQIPSMQTAYINYIYIYCIYCIHVYIYIYIIYIIYILYIYIWRWFYSVLHAIVVITTPCALCVLLSTNGLWIHWDTSQCNFVDNQLH